MTPRRMGKAPVNPPAYWAPTPRHRRCLPPSSSCKAESLGKPLHALNLRRSWLGKKPLLSMGTPKRHPRGRMTAAPRVGLAMVVMAGNHTKTMSQRPC
jgi:hypothetical protein